MGNYIMGAYRRKDILRLGLKVFLPWRWQWQSWI